MALHLATFFERQGARFLEQPRGQPDLPDVVNKSSDVRELLLVRRQTHPLSDVLRVDRNGRGMACRVPIPRIKCCHKSRSEREVCALKCRIRTYELVRETALILIEREEALRRQRRQEEQGEGPRRHVDVRGA